MTAQHGNHLKQGGLVLGALGVVYGDIGTSPLYALQEAFTEEAHPLTVNQINVYGIGSLAFWSLTLIISVKYLAFVMRAENNGEGGILALTSLVMKRRTDGVARAGLLVGLGVFGTALLYGDGIITPAISVLSAVGGLARVSPSLESWVMPIAIVILVGLFSVQKRGTGAVGRVFGPIMIVWFTTIAVLGLRQVILEPRVLESVNPVWMVRYFQHETGHAFLALGSIFLVVTGGEALYADMGHFGRRPIMRGWYRVVFPALLLCYWGQCALLIRDPEAIEGLFFNMAPKPLLIPLVVLATAATIIASQALISGVFSLTAQAVQLDYLPRIRIDHTSHHHAGQIYVPLVNWLLAAGCIGLVIGFRTASNLAAAYGIAVTMTMAITTLIFFRVLTDRWKWQRWKAFLVCVPMLLIELGFLGANIPKIPKGGWFALVVALVLMVQMQTWRRGRQLVATRIRRGERPIGELLESLDDVQTVPGVGVFLFKDLGKSPPALVNNLRHNKVLHHTTVVVSVDTSDEPRVPEAARMTVVGYESPTEMVAVRRALPLDNEPGVYQVSLTFGFMDALDVPTALMRLNDFGVPFDRDEVTYFIGHESIISGAAPGMHPWLEQLFVWLSRGADSAVRFFNLPPDQVFEVGSRVEI